MLVVLCGCAGQHPREAPLPQSSVARTPAVTIDQVTGEAELEFSVLIYNIAGLPWPVRSGRPAALTAIGRELGALRARGEGPDVVMLQEAFTSDIEAVITQAGYPNVVRGPARGDPSPPPPAGLDAIFLAERRFLKGEKTAPLLNSGLYVLSNFPIVAKRSFSFGRNVCAGYDCLANKGILMAEMEIPGVSETVKFLTSHMNARGASGVSTERANLAHNLQMDQIDAFLNEYLRAGALFVYGGDFNMRRSPERLEHVAKKRPYASVRRYCTLIVDDCEILMSWDGDAPWMDTQDLQGIVPGERIFGRPIRVQALFDEPIDGALLSDHDGYWVHYRLSWQL